MEGTGRSKVFISYSRADRAFTEELAAALGKSADFDILFDRVGIGHGEAWKERLGRLIIECDTMVFVLSPDSVSSEVCAWEIEEARQARDRAREEAQALGVELEAVRDALAAATAAPPPPPPDSISGDEADKFVFRIASLRNVAETWPYFHDGSVETLGEAIRVIWDGRDSEGAIVPAGVYFARLAGDSVTDVARMVLIK